MIDTSRNTTPDVCQKVTRKSRDETKLVTVSDTPEADLSIMAFYIRYFANLSTTRQINCKSFFIFDVYLPFWELENFIWNVF